ncbi:MAG: hypothetical protein OXB92_15820 [Acidimicrobiaceae bacterium]|nr:hypothetical protein [Acidimicrobiaceae bacterium]
MHTIPPTGNTTSTPGGATRPSTEVPLREPWSMISVAEMLQWPVDTAG